MANRPNSTRLLASIRNALWLIASILLIQTGFHLDDFRKTPFAEIIMLLGFWIGLILFENGKWGQSFRIVLLAPHGRNQNGVSPFGLSY